MTNADKIRQMSDKEMAAFLPVINDLMCEPTDKCMKMVFNRGECGKTRECALKWLQSENLKNGYAENKDVSLVNMKI